MAGLLLQSLLILLLSLALRSAGQAQDTRARIVNGVQCPRGTHPWQVALYDKGVFQCAGVLVSKQWVLTVAHCLLSEYVAQMGSDLLVDENAQKIRVTKLFLHPRYDPTTNIHDIMLLKLSSPAKLSPSVRTISVPSSCRQPRRNCALSGWGNISTHVVKNPSELMCSNVHLISYKDCKKFYPTLLRKFTICAAPHDKFSVACKRRCVSSHWTGLDPDVITAGRRRPQR
ncbi:PREDICTED: kallikrein-7-like [Miniopterus natalensis]|uniref:kallikrein-7-like n=1 Tax=Miniopterus natalensis TaxID=291302 RepID=UPI0007A6AE5F|nr:PREDICTED: kallikrein-7-like [Miniopterus natalensis]